MKVNDAKKTLSARLQELMDEKKLNNKMLCATFNDDRDYDKSITLTESKLSEILRCKRESSYTVIAKLAHVLGVSCDYLLGLTDVRSVNPTVKAVSEITKIPAGSIDKYSSLIKEYPRLNILSTVIGFLMEDVYSLYKESQEKASDDPETTTNRLLYESVLGSLYKILGMKDSYSDYCLVDTELLLDESNSHYMVTPDDAQKYPNNDPIVIDLGVIAQYIGSDIGKKLNYRSIEYHLYMKGNNIEDHYSRVYEIAHDPEIEKIRNWKQ